jgi:hypothetical protein
MARPRVVASPLRRLMGLLLLTLLACCAPPRCVGAVAVMSTSDIDGMAE